MNRREFCRTATLIFAGSVCTGVALRREDRTTRFRAQKVFLQSWDVDNVRKKLESICANGCNGLLLVPERRSCLRWKKLIESEANRLGLTVFVPACLTNKFLRQVQTVAPLAYESGILQHIDGKPADNGGFLLLDKSGNAFGLILYDSSRCLWTGFTLSSAGAVRDTIYDVNSSRLVAARWIDQAWGG